MINRLNEFRKMGAQNGFEPIEYGQDITQENVEKDRELISQFLPHTK